MNWGSPLLLATEQVVRSLSLEVISKTFWKGASHCVGLLRSSLVPSSNKMLRVLFFPSEGKAGPFLVLPLTLGKGALNPRHPRLRAGNCSHWGHWDQRPTGQLVTSTPWNVLSHPILSAVSIWRASYSHFKDIKLRRQKFKHLAKDCTTGTWNHHGRTVQPGSSLRARLPRRNLCWAASGCGVHGPNLFAPSLAFQTLGLPGQGKTSHKLGENTCNHMDNKGYSHRQYTV